MLLETAAATTTPSIASKRRRRRLVRLLIQNSLLNSKTFRSAHEKTVDSLERNSSGEIIVDTDRATNGKHQHDDDSNTDDYDGNCCPSSLLFLHRTVALPVNDVLLFDNTTTTTTCQSRRRRTSKTTAITIPLYIVPSLITYLDSTFNALVVHHERTMLKKQSLTAWMATLGGGYFFIKQLSKSLRLARQQRILALQIGNVGMARHCSLNEAYNLIYAGRFNEAKAVLAALEAEVKADNKTNGTTNNDNNSTKKCIQNDVVHDENIDEEASLALRQCRAARIFLRRLKKLSNRLKKYHTGDSNENHTKDDFQRIRIVEQQS